MTLHEISKIAKEGDSYRRKAWTDPHLIFKWSFISLGSVSLSDAIADDWEIVKKKVTKTEKKKIFWRSYNGNERLYYSTSGIALVGEYLSELFPADTLINATFEWEEEE